MPSYKDFYGSDYLSAKSLGTRKIKAKVLECTPATMEGKNGKTRTRLSLTLQGEDKQVPLNATNADRLGKKFGENFSKWVGRTVMVSTHKTTYAGDDVDGLLVTPV